MEEQQSLPLLVAEEEHQPQEPPEVPQLAATVAQEWRTHIRERALPGLAEAGVLEPEQPEPEALGEEEMRAQRHPEQTQLPIPAAAVVERMAVYLQHPALAVPA